MVAPAVAPVGVPACLSTVTLGAARMIVSVESVAYTLPPDGGFAWTVAVLATWPASTSACVSAYVAVQVTWALGARLVVGHETVPTLASETATAVTVTAPEFVTTKVYGIVDPTVAPDGVPACLSSVTDASGLIETSVESVAFTTTPVGDCAATEAVLATCPLSASAWVSVYVAVHVVCVPGASVVAGQVIVPTTGSVTVTACRVTLPVLATTNVYGIVAPAALPLGVPTCLSSATDGDAAIRMSVESEPPTAGPDGGVAETDAVLARWPASTSACVSV